jgi:hypothetical protein
MTTLNSIIETGLNTSHEITKNFKKTMATITPLFDNMDVLTNLIVFFIFITYTNYRISNMSISASSIQNYHQHNIINAGNNPTSHTAVIITAVYFGSIINMYRFIPVDYNIIINVIFGGLIFDFYQYVSNIDDSVFDFIESIIIISYLLLAYSYISTYPMIPKSFQLGFIIYSSIIYLFNEKSKNKVGSYFEDKSYLIVYFLYIYIFINNIKLTNSRSKNIINIITIISVSLIMLANYMVFYSSINQFVLFTQSWGQNDESVGYLFNKNIKDYDFKNKSSFGMLNHTDYSASWSKKTLDIRKQKILDNLDDRLSQIYSVAGPMMIYMIYQMLFMVLSYVIISSILSKYYNPFKLFSKFFVYIYITNVTLFQLNFLIREYNFLGMRKAFYKNTTTCLVSDKEFDKQYGNAPTDKQTKEECVTIKDGGAEINYSWIDLYTQAHISTESKLERINKIGVWITIYSILYFSIVYSCDYFAYIYDSEILKLIAILILALVIILYTVIHKQTSTINTIVDMPVPFDLQNSPLIQRFINNPIDIADYGPMATETYATNTQDLYDIKEIFNNILMMTLIYTIIFYTHRFFD